MKIRELDRKELAFFGKNNVIEYVSDYVRFKRILDDENYIIESKNVYSNSKLGWFFIIDYSRFIKLKVDFIYPIQSKNRGLIYLIKFNKDNFIINKSANGFQDFEDLNFLNIKGFEDLKDIVLEQEEENKNNLYLLPFNLDI
jgi:hypothetical protein